LKNNIKGSHPREKDYYFPALIYEQDSYLRDSSLITSCSVISYGASYLAIWFPTLFIPIFG